MSTDQFLKNADTKPRRGRLARRGERRKEPWNLSYNINDTMNSSHPTVPAMSDRRRLRSALSALPIAIISERYESSNDFFNLSMSLCSADADA